MARRTRYGNVASLGRSHVVPYRRGEDPARRRARRLYTNLKHQAEVRAWAQRHEIALTLSNGGNHWRFALGTRVAEWWPSSAKLVLDRQYDAGVQAHDFQQVLHYLETQWNLDRHHDNA